MTFRWAWPLAGFALASVVALSGCTGGASTSVTPSPAEVSPTVTSSPAQASPSVAPRPPRDEWPFVMSACPGASEKPRLIVALGTSETAGWGVRKDESYSPQEAYPARYAEMLCEELGVAVELHSYFPSQLGNQLAPLSWWNERVSNDAALRSDLSTAWIVILWGMASHDMVPALFLGGCRGDWPDPLRGCLEKASASIPAEMEQLFGAIGDLVVDTETVLAADAFLPPSLIGRWGDKPYWEELRTAIADPRATAMPLARKHGFTFIDTMAVLNGPTLAGQVDPDYLQADGLHLTAAGQLAVAQVFIDEDGLGDD